MRAHELLASEPRSPPAFRGVRAVPLPIGNSEYPPLNRGSLQAVPLAEVQEFKRYISTIPWDFRDLAPPINGRVIGSEAGVRQFVDSSIILTAWLVILAMALLLADGESHRGYDILCYPVEAITRARVDGGRSWFTLIVLIKLKGLGVLSSLESLGSGRLPESDDLMTVTRQLRRYADEGETPTVFVMDNTHALYLRFSDAADENAGVEFAVATSGEDRDRFPTFTIRELFVFSAWRSFGDLNIFPRDYTGAATHRTRELDYKDEVEYGSLPATGTRAGAPGEVRHSTRAGRSAGEFSSHCLTPCYHDIFPNPIIKAADMTPEKLADSGYPSYPAEKRRAVRAFFARPGKPGFLDITVHKLAGKVGVIADLEDDNGRGRPATPLPTTGLVVKFFRRGDSIPCQRECDAYHRLRSVQGYDLPFSYGLYTSGDWDGYILMLEGIEGDTIEAIRDDLLDEPIVRLKELFLEAWGALKRIHALQIAHGDIHEENIILSKEGSFVFIDWEASRYQSPFAYSEDEIALRRVFRNLGLSEASLKLWALDLLSPDQ